MTVLYTSIFSSLFPFLLVVAWSIPGAVSVHFRCRILSRYLFMKICIRVSVLCIRRHVDHPLTFELNVLSLELFLICFTSAFFSTR